MSQNKEHEPNMKTHKRARLKLRAVQTGLHVALLAIDVLNFVIRAFGVLGRTGSQNFRACDTGEALNVVSVFFEHKRFSRVHGFRADLAFDPTTSKFGEFGVGSSCRARSFCRRLFLRKPPLFEALVTVNFLFVHRTARRGYFELTRGAFEAFGVEWPFVERDSLGRIDRLGTDVALGATTTEPRCHRVGRWLLLFPLDIALFLRKSSFLETQPAIGIALKSSDIRGSSLLVTSVTFETLRVVDLFVEADCLGIVSRFVTDDAFGTTPAEFACNGAASTFHLLLRSPLHISLLLSQT